MKFKEAISALVLGLLAVVAATSLIALISSIGNRDDRVENIEKKVEEIKTALSPYEDRENLFKTLIISNFNNSVKDDQPTDSFSKKILVSGRIGRGYLYVRASADSNALKANEDDVYVKIAGTVNGEHKEFGGHLIESKSLDTPKSKTATELLFSLSDIKYKESYKQSDIEIISGDWIKIFNTGTAQFIVGFSSTQKSGTVEELSLYYQCEPESQCSISLL